MALLVHLFAFMHTGNAGAAARAFVSLPHLTPGTLAFLTSAR